MLNMTSGDTLFESGTELGNIKGINRRNQRVSQSIQFPPAKSAKRKPFVPLADLLQRKHDDRVSEYLEKMKGLSIDEIVNTQILSKTKDQTPEKNSTLNPMSPQPRGNNVSLMTMGVTPKQASIVESARNKMNSISMAPKLSSKSSKFFCNRIFVLEQKLERRPP